MERHGFTLLEVMLTVGIFAVVAVLIGFFGQDVSDLGSFVEKTLQNQEDLDLAFQRITTEIRSMGPSSAGAYPLETAEADTLVFYADIDQDGALERVRYFLATSTLEKGVVEPSGNPSSYVTSSETVRTVVQNVTATSTPLFEYFDADYTGSETPLTPPVDVIRVRVIRVSLSADVNPGVAPHPAFYTNTINMRNVRSN